MASEKNTTKLASLEEKQPKKTQTKPKRVSNRTGKAEKAQNLAPNKLMLLITVVPRSKAEFYLDLLQSFEVNLQLEVSAFGTAKKSFGFLEEALEKQALFSIIREDNVSKALIALEEKFESIRGGKGVAFTVPFTSMVGVAAYQFLSNKQ